jgi:DNA (cytosine-5)-methyltransferase 1
MFDMKGGISASFNIVPPKVVPSTRFKDFLDTKAPDCLYLTDSHIDHLKEKHHISSFSVRTPLCFDVYNKKIKYDEYCITITQPEYNSLRVTEVPRPNRKEIVRKMSIDEQLLYGL